MLLNMFFPRCLRKARSQVRICVQTPTLHPGAIYGGSKSITTEKKTQTAVDRLLTYAASKTRLTFAPLSCFRPQGLRALQTSYMSEQQLAYFGSNPSNNSNNCMAELLLLLERFKQREIQLVPKSIISLHKLLPG